MDARAPFVPLEPVRASLWQKLLRRRPRENAAIVINNLFADAARVRDVSAADVARVCREYRSELGGPLGGRLERLYRDYLMYCLSDRHLSQQEIDDLAHLKSVLRLGSETVAAIHEYVSRQVYSRSVGEVLEDGVIDDEERAFLVGLRQDLALSGRVAGRIVDAQLRQRTRN